MNDMFLCTPRPFPRESALGWVLRASELNSLQSSRSLLKLSNSWIGAATKTYFDPSNLAHWFGFQASDLNFMSYAAGSDRSLCQFRGHSLPRRMLELTTARVCIACVYETGYADAFWDLSVVTTCPKHGTQLTQTCTNCRSNISWLRPGLLVCSCESQLIDEERRQPDNVIQLHKRLDYIAFSLQSIGGKNDESTQQGLDVLSNTPLDFSLKLVLVTGIFATYGYRHRQSLSIKEKHHVLKVASEIFANWPVNFFDFLDKLANTPLLKRQKNWIRNALPLYYNALFQNEATWSHETPVHKAYMQYLKNRRLVHHTIYESKP